MEKHEVSLEPEDWNAFRALAHRMMDDMVDYLATLREHKAWQPMPDSVRAYFNTPLPEEGTPEETIYADYLEQVIPYPMGNQHPRSWGWVMTSGTALGMLAEMLTGATTNQMGGGDHAGVYVEMQVIEWFKQLFDYPAEAGGVLVSGASIANLTALIAARNTTAHYNLRKEGLQSGHARMIMYMSSEAHSCHQKNAEAIGLGSDAIRMIPVNERYEMDIPALRAAIAADKAAGLHPFCIVATAGTVKTGAFDDMVAIADLCAEEGLWMHVDGAFGALVAFSQQPELRRLIAGMERSDSLAFDMHKWMSVPFEAGCVLVRSQRDHYNAFTLTPDYLTHGTRGITAAPIWFSDYGLQLSRGFRALKVWMSMKVYGARRYGEVIEMNIAQARYLADLVDASPELERTADVPLNIVCFRYVAPGLDEAALNALNTELLIRLQESGIAVTSNATNDGKYSLRMANVNHRSTYADFDLLAETVTRLGREIMREEAFA